MHHPIFQRFQGYPGPREADNWIDWIGARFPRRLIAPFPTAEAEEFFHPPCGSEYFEWIDLLSAVAAAGDRFTMVELGAGWGRWGIRAAMAARQRGIAELDIRLVEAEPQHAEWARECVALNGLSDAISVTHAALSYQGGPVPFTIAWEGYHAANWYGQTIVRQEPGPATGQHYFGREIHQHPAGALIFVPSVTLEEVIDGIPRVDLLDADLQGAELDLVENAIALMTKRVALAHIATHSAEIEDRIRECFGGNGWQCRWDFSVAGSRETPFGPIEFGDGVQAWSNPNRREP